MLDSLLELSCSQTETINHVELEEIRAWPASESARDVILGPQEPRRYSTVLMRLVAHADKKACASSTWQQATQSTLEQANRCPCRDQALE